MNSRVIGAMLIIGPILTMGVWMFYNFETSDMSPSEEVIAIMANTNKAEISSILNVFWCAVDVYWTLFPSQVIEK